MPPLPLAGEGWGEGKGEHHANPLTRLPLSRCRAGAALTPAERTLPEEAAVAFLYNGESRAVMMATPADLEDFALGFSLAEGIVASPAQIEALDIVRRGDDGIELRMRLRGASATVSDARPGALASAKRLTAPTGCGLCGVPCLSAALRPVRLARRPVLRLQAQQIGEAMRALEAAQALNREARALHAAAFWRPGDGLVALREDVGRHCALDKLAGALARQGIAGDGGVVLLTSRVSVELVQKTARLGAAVLVAVSAPTALAVRAAEAAGITLVALARGDDFEVYSHAARIGTRGAALPAAGHGGCTQTRITLQEHAA